FSIRLLMANDRLHSSLRDDTSTLAMERTSWERIDPMEVGRNGYAQTGSHDGGRGSDGDRVGLQYASESCERGRSGRAFDRIGEHRPWRGIGVSIHHQ